MKLQNNVQLKNYTTFRIGGPAKYFIEAKNKKEIIEALKWAKNNNLPFFILGGGSNLLVSDKGYNGVVIRVRNEKMEARNENSKCRIFVEAGSPLSKLVVFSLRKGLTGLEWAVGIPGTVGGAVTGNAGAFGGEMKDSVKTVEVFDYAAMRVKKIKNKECGFGYRNSIFKKNTRLIILSCELLIEKGDKKNIKEKIEKYLDYRQQKHPKEPSAGSVFKRVGKEPAAVLIDRAGLTGKKFGKACVSQKHSNFIINSDGAKAEHVRRLIAFIKKSVKKKFKKSLQEEIKFLGKF